MIDDPVMDRLGIAPGGDQTLLTHQGKMLRQGRLRQIDLRLDLPDRQFSVSQLTQDHQALFVAERAQQGCSTTGAVGEQGGIETGEVEHESDYIH